MTARADPSAAVSKPSVDKPRKPLARRIARVSLWMILGVCTLVIALLLALLYSATVTRWAVELGIGMYSDSIPGSIAVTSIEGRLGTELQLSGIELRDRSGALLARSGTLTVRLRPWALAGGTAAVEKLELAQTDVVVDGGAWGDLAPVPESPPPPPDPNAGLGPNLPVAVTLDLELVDTRILSRDGGEAAPMVDDLQVSISAKAEGERARVAINRISAHLTQPAISLDELAMVIYWRDPEVSIVGLNLVSSAAEVNLVHTRLDLETLKGHVLGEVRALAPGLQLAGLQQGQDEGAVELAAYRGEQGMRAHLTAGLGERASVVVDMDGPLDLHKQLTAEIGASLDPTLLGLGPGPRIEPRLQLSADGPPTQAVVEATVDCGSCEPAAGQLGLEVVGNIETRDLVVDAQAEFAALGVHFGAHAELTGGEPTAASLNLEVPQLATIKIPGLDLPELAGGLEVAARCEARDPEILPCTASAKLKQFHGGGVKLESLGVEMQATIDRTPDRAPEGDSEESLAIAFDVEAKARNLVASGRRFTSLDIHAKGTPQAIDAEAAVTRGPGETLRLAALVKPGPPLVLDLRALDGKIGRLRADLQRPSEILVDGQKISVSHLDLDLAGGNIKASGRFDPSQANDLEVAVEGLELGRFRELVPGLPVSGTVDLNAHVAGTSKSPRVTLKTELGGLVWKGERLGSVNLDATLDDDSLRASTSVKLAGAGAGPTLVADLDVPLRVDLESGAVTQLPRHHAAKLELEAFDLAWVNRLMPADGPKLAGTLTAKVDVRGHPERPKLDVAVSGEGLAYGPLVIGDPTLQINDDRATIHGELSVEQGFADEVSVVADVPGRLRLSPPGFRLSNSRELALELSIRQFDLVTVEPLLGVLAELGPEAKPSPELPMLGKVDVDVKLRGSRRDHQLDVGIKTNGVRFDGHNLGATEVVVGHSQDILTAEVHHRGGLLETLDVAAKLPVVVKLDRGKFAWQPRGHHQLKVSARGVDPARTVDFGVLHPISGAIHVDVDAEAVDGEPRSNVHIEVASLRCEQTPLVTGGLDLAVEPTSVTLGSRLSGAGASHIELGVQVPVELSLLEGPVWRQEFEHTLNLDARVGREILAAVVPPKMLGQQAYASVTLAAKGTTEAFSSDSQIYAEVRDHETGRQSVAADLHVDPHHQALDVAMDPGGVASRIELHATSKVDIPSASQGKGLGDAAVLANITVPYVPLTTLAPFLPDSLAEPKGHLQGQFRIAGTAVKPSLQGALSLKDGALTVVPLQQTIRGINLEVSASGQEVAVRQLDFRAGAGGGSLTGKARYSPEAGLFASGELELDKFSIAPPGLPEAQISTRVKTKASMKDADTNVDVTIHQSSIWIDDSNTGGAQRIPSNPNVTFVDQKGRLAAKKAAAIKAAPDPSKKSSKLTLHVALADPVLLRGAPVEMNWGGEIAVTVVDGQQEIEGSMTANRGFVDLFGTKLEIEFGEVTLVDGAEGLDPYLNLVASSEIDGYKVSAKLRGRASSPEIEFSAEPALPEYQVLALLITGNAELDDTTRDEVEAKAASLLAVVASPGLQRSMRKHLGVDRVRLSFGESLMQPILTVGRRISRKVYTEASYQQNASLGDNTVELEVQYNFKPEWSLETYFGNAAKGGVDVFWRRHFGEPKARGKQARGQPKDAKKSPKSPPAESSSTTPTPTSSTTPSNTP